MANSQAKDRKKWELRGQALAANGTELTHLTAHGGRLGELQGEVKSLTAEQASLTARKQEVSKQLKELMQEGNKLVAFLDAGVKQHYGNRAEKLVEFGLQPFRSRPRLVLVGPDGQRLKPSSAAKEAPDQPETP